MTEAPEALALARQAHEEVRESGLFADVKPWGELASYDQARLIATAEAVAAKAREQDESPSTVTVVTDDNRLETWNADSVEVDEGLLYVGQGGKDGLADTYGVYAAGQWSRAEVGGHRAVADLTTAERLKAAEATIREITYTARDIDNADDEARDAIKRITARHGSTR